MNYKFFLFFTMLALSVVIVGCTPKSQMYYWGNYSGNLYNAKKNPCAESLSEHKAGLEAIIDESKTRNLRVPPGVYAELGYIYSMENNTQRAIELFQLEQNTYPESGILMGRLIQQAEKRAADGNERGNTPAEISIQNEKEIGDLESEKN